MLDSNGAKQALKEFQTSEKTYWPVFQQHINNVITSKETGNLILRLFSGSDIVDIMIKPEDIVVCSSHLGMDTPIAIDTIEDAFKFMSVLLGTEIPNSDSND